MVVESRGVRAVVLLAAGCVSDPSPTAAPAATVRMEFDHTQEFFAAPFPSEHLRVTGGGYRLDAFPNPRRSEYLRGIAALAQSADGFGITMGAFVTTTAPVDPTSLPDLWGSVRADASVFLTVAEGPDAGVVRIPVRVTFHESDAPSQAENLLGAVPLQGVPMCPSTRYALVVTRALRDASGRAFAPSDTMSALRRGASVAGLTETASREYVGALNALRANAVDLDRVVALGVFRTGDPAAQMRRFVEHARAHAPLQVTQAPTPREVFDGYCVYQGELRVPVWQRGEPPYTSVGGGWTTAPDGTPMMQRTEPSRVVITVPRRPMPASGYPLVMFVRTGGGGDRPLVDRGVQAMTGGDAIAPGTGPAREFAREGFAGVSWDGPHGGPRNVSHGDEQFLMFNVNNLEAMRDNVRQSAIEADLLALAMTTLRVDVSSCPGATGDADGARFDASHAVLMGHSMGATIAPVAAAFEPSFRAVILSGAGGSWIENIVYKEHPVPVRPFAESLLRYTGSGSHLERDDPALSLFQWAMEPADPPVYAVQVTASHDEIAARHVLMMQGIVDHYMMPSIAAAASLSFGLDLAGTGRDALDMRLRSFDPLARLLPLQGLTQRMGSVSGNRRVDGALLTLAVRQYTEDGIEDGHEVAFQTEGPKRDYRCFLRGYLRGAPAIPAEEGGDCDP